MVKQARARKFEEAYTMDIGNKEKNERRRHCFLEVIGNK